MANEFRRMVEGFFSGGDGDVQGEVTVSQLISQCDAEITRSHKNRMRELEDTIIKMVDGFFSGGGGKDQGEVTASKFISQCDAEITRSRKNGMRELEDIITRQGKKMGASTDVIHQTIELCKDASR